MAFDQSTRNRLQKFVNEARTLLTEEFTRQLQATYGLDPKAGSVAAVDSLVHLDNRQRQTANLLREILNHYVANSSGKNEQEKVRAALDRLVREQGFTVLNRMAALRMAEARGLLIESIDKGYNAKGFQLYKMLVGTSHGETGDAYRNYLFSLFDEFSIDLELLFDRHNAHGQLFPRESALLELLAQINHHEIEHLWAEDETIGWIYQYYNSQEERKRMRKESQAPRSSRELAVRNQFFTPRYVVEFLVDNTLGRLWFEATGGQTNLYELCQYLLVKPEELAAKRAGPPAVKLRDPRTLKLLDPACGSMHFGLYAFDLFLDIYREAWNWEQQNGPGSLDAATYSRDDIAPLSQVYASEDEYLRDVPRLIIEHNIYGVDIDPRAAQIASLALWLRAQRAWHEAGTKALERPTIGQGHVLAAVAPPAEKDLRERFAAQLDTLDAELFGRTLELLKGVPEQGVLLQVDRELPRLVRQVFGEHGDLFRETDEQQWQKAEERLRAALTEFAEASQASFQGRLYAQDALQGFQLIDLCSELFDVVVMNPPFGSVSLGVKEYLSDTYPSSRNDLLGIFVDRGLDLLRPGGRLGAITSRTCFFLTSFSDWREKVVLGRSGVEVIADLGQGVMDDAMVEAAAYVLELGAKHPTTNVIRAIADEDRERAIVEAVANHREGESDARLFRAERKTFNLLPDSPFVYWVDADTIKQFDSEEHFEPSMGSVRVGLQTGDDPRFVRAVWEVAPEDTQFCYYPTNDEAFCSFDDPIVRAYFQRRNEGTPRWAFHVKAGASQPWYSPITLKLNYYGYGEELRSFKDAKGKPRAFLRSQAQYYRPGFSWTRRAVRFYPYVIPSNCIPSVSRYMAFPKLGRETEALGVCASRLASAFFRFYGEKFEFPNFLVENVKMLPWPQLANEAKQYFNALITTEVENRRQAYQNFEPFHEFLLPAKIRDYTDGGSALAFDRHSLIGEKGELWVAGAYGFTPRQAQLVERDLKEAITHQHRETAEFNDADPSNEDSDFSLDTSSYAIEEAHISYLVGCTFGRWDIRFATGERDPEPLGDPFAPLPVCPPGLLQNALGLPAREYELPDNYPLDIAWSGVLVDDENHPRDVVQHVRYALRVVWKERVDSIEDEMCSQLGAKSLREYFRRSSGFFADHLKRYTKSNRKAPIYWPLSTLSGRYTLWLYYPSLTSQTLFTAVNDFVEPTLKQVRDDLDALRNKGSNRSRQEEKQLENATDFAQELADLRDTLLSIAPRYSPNHDDGVQISAAPLWPLFNHKPWQKVLKDTCEKLEQGDYDWAHLAMNYWPERVMRKCHQDRSLAIAHDVVDLFWHEVELPVKRGKKTTGETKLEWQPRDLSEAELSALIKRLATEVK